ncbi:MAG: hypothetical protein J7K31_03605 [Candidatus Aenigmarchaeota archaeon]|nr:hypothetical protein [Candidatus Aenigmarchaeota archaeon]
MAFHTRIELENKDIVIKYYNDKSNFDKWTRKRILLKHILYSDIVTESSGLPLAFLCYHFNVLKKEILTYNDRCDARQQGLYPKDHMFLNELTEKGYLIETGKGLKINNKNPIINFDWANYLFFIYEKAPKTGFTIEKTEDETKEFNEKVEFIEKNIPTLFEELNKEGIIKERGKKLKSKRKICY